MRACEDNDYTTVREAGWMPVFSALQEWWARRFDLMDLRPYVDVLRDEPAASVMDALDGLRGEEWRPAPSLVYRRVSEARAKADQQMRTKAALRGNDARPEESVSALIRVRQLLDEGQKVCECSPRPVHLLIEELDGQRWSTEELAKFRTRRREWTATRHGPKPLLPPHVIRCRDCRGIEQGQAFAAEDMISPEPDFRIPS